jgi:hypothetical protein
VSLIVLRRYVADAFSPRRQLSQRRLPGTWSEGHQTSFRCMFTKCRPIRSPKVQSTLLEPSCVRALSTSSGVPAWTCRASSWVAVSVQNYSIMRLLVAHEGCRGRVVQDGFCSKSIVFRAWCSVLLSSSSSGPVIHCYVLQDVFSTSEPLRLYISCSFGMAASIAGGVSPV